MRLLLVRHSLAEDPRAGTPWGLRDELRPLTEEGTRRMRMAATSLQSVMQRIDIVTASNFLRAQQTAQIIADQFAVPLSSPIAELRSGGDIDRVIDALSNYDPDSCLCAVGHAPSIAYLCSALISGAEHSNINFGRGTTALLEFYGAPQRGHGTLKWLMSLDLLNRP